MNTVSLLHMILAFAGGVWGAACGGLTVFIICGFSALLGTGIVMATGNTSYQQLVTWGSFLGPHVAFAGAVAAAACAARLGKLPSGRDIGTALFGLNSPLVLAVGGCFGMLGYLLKNGLDRIPPLGGLPWINSIALAIIVNGLAVRFIFGRSGLFGFPVGGRRFIRPADFSNMFPWAAAPLQQLLLTCAVALATAAVGRVLPGSFGLVFGLSALSLLFLQFGARVPVTLHIAWSVEYLGFWTRDYGWALIIGITAAVLVEYAAHLFLLFSDTHIDPPALTVALVFMLPPLLSHAGLLKVTAPWSILAALLLAAAAYPALRPLSRPV